MIPVERAATITRISPPSHGGIGSVASRLYFDGHEFFPVVLDMDILPPGASEGMHVHDSSDREYGEMHEFYLVIAGVARLIVNGESVDLGPGDAAVAEAGTPHDLINIGEDPLTVLVMYSPPLSERPQVSE